jgi:NAD(P)-dependent dehydrogenase (short-subunit alcohol dehydrogenase family)/mannose-6-phosphate isomerase-like protein (cupin superfamily)
LENRRRDINMTKERVVRADEVMPFSPAGPKGKYESRLIVESEGVGSTKLMVIQATMGPGTSSGKEGAHPIPYDETYYILRGQARVEFGEGEESYDVAPDTAVFIAAGTKHKITNTGTDDLVFLSMWPLQPMEEGINGVCDQRKRAWGTTFRKVAVSKPERQSSETVRVSQDAGASLGAIPNENADTNIMAGKNVFDLSGRVAIITGSAGKLGRSMARGFADFGAAVVCADCDPSVVEETAERVKKGGGEALAVRCDVTRQEDVDALVARTLEKFGDIDILVNSAGITKHSPPSDFLMKDWMHIIDVNLKGTFLCCQAVGRIMEKNRKGSIINLSSIVGVVGVGRGNSAYAASKGGVNGLTLELAIEWAPYGIRVNAIAPCQFNGPQFIKGLQKEFPDTYDALLKKMISNIPLGRLGKSDEIIGTAVYLASDASSMVTGHIVYLDGGYLAR